MKFQKNISGNPLGRPIGATDKRKTHIKKIIQEALEVNVYRVQEELGKLEGKAFLEMYFKLLEYIIPKLQRQTIELDQEKIIRTFNIIPASKVKKK